MNPKTIFFKKGDRSPIIKRIKGQLKKLGYDISSIDDFFDAKTELFVKHFQKKYNLPQTGKLDKKTSQKIWYEATKITSGITSKIYVVPKRMKLGDTDPVVNILQKNLKEIGYNVELTGIFDKQTENAVKSFSVQYLGRPQFLPISIVNREIFQQISAVAKQIQDHKKKKLPTPPATNYYKLPKPSTPRFPLLEDQLIKDETVDAETNLMPIVILSIVGIGIIMMATKKSEEKK